MESSLKGKEFTNSDLSAKEETAGLPALGVYFFASETKAEPAITTMHVPHSLVRFGN